ncbi:hypothetical protein RCO28_00505 [Streptomyces sp. LHD-70]|uniref:hypothetical protein n=1 Tax=Streptomyces sp. LHD-70 TaxID=3072140 RepID=UPI00280C5E70|nr:hypothetical protein [Streptomyces sp. LHD-70]MDQ8700972.1 hypothetical protein [Streptomyces sp. LHD-70]
MEEPEKRPVIPAPPSAPASSEGCLVTAIRLPVRIVVLVLVVPVRMVWDALVVCGRFLDRALLRPLGRALAWLGRALFVVPWVWAYRNLLTPFGHGLVWTLRTLVARPAQWLCAHVLTPLGQLLVVVTKFIGDVLGWTLLAVCVWPWVGLWRYVLVPVGRGLAWLGRVLCVVPAVWLYRRLLTPLGHGVAWVVRGIGAGIAWTLRALGTALAFLWRWGVVVPVGFVWRWVVVVPVVFVWRWLIVVPVRFLWTWLVVVPAGFLWRRVLVPVGLEVGAAFGHAWRIAGYVSRAVGRFLGGLLRWTYRHVLTPVGHLLRDGLWRPVARTVRQAVGAARSTARQVRADLRRALFGAPRPAPEAVVPAPHGEPTEREPRTLGSSTTAYTKLTKD